MNGVFHVVSFQAHDYETVVQDFVRTHNLLQLQQGAYCNAFDDRKDCVESALASAMRDKIASTVGEEIVEYSYGYHAFEYKREAHAGDLDADLADLLGGREARGDGDHPSGRPIDSNLSARAGDTSPPPPAAGVRSPL